MGDTRQQRRSAIAGKVSLGSKLPIRSRSREWLESARSRQRPIRPGSWSARSSSSGGGRPRVLRRRPDHEGQVGIGGRSQSERRRELARIVSHRLRPSRVIREGGGRNPELRRQSTRQKRDRVLHVRQPHPRMAKQRQLYGNAQLICRAAASLHEILVGPGRGVLPRQSVGVVRDAENPRRSSSLSSGRRAMIGPSLVPKMSIRIVDTAGIREVFCGRK